MRRSIRSATGSAKCRRRRARAFEVRAVSSSGVLPSAARPLRRVQTELR